MGTTAPARDTVGASAPQGATQTTDVSHLSGLQGEQSLRLGADALKALAPLLLAAPPEGVTEAQAFRTSSASKPTLTLSREARMSASMLAASDDTAAHPAAKAFARAAHFAALTPTSTSPLARQVANVIGKHFATTAGAKAAGDAQQVINSLRQRVATGAITAQAITAAQGDGDNRGSGGQGSGGRGSDGRGSQDDSDTPPHATTENAQTQGTSGTRLVFPKDVIAHVADMLSQAGDVDITALVEEVMFDCSHESESDLRELATQMQTANAQKASLRAAKTAYATAKAGVQSKEQTEYENLLSSNQIAPSVTLEAYEAWRPITVPAATLNADGSYTVPEPQLPDLPALPASFLPQAALPATGSDATGKTGSATHGGDVESGNNTPPPNSPLDKYGLMPEQEVILKTYFDTYATGWVNQQKAQGNPNPDVEAWMRDKLGLQPGADISTVWGNNQKLSGFLTGLSAPGTYGPDQKTVAGWRSTQSFDASDLNVAVFDGYGVSGDTQNILSGMLAGMTPDSDSPIGQQLVSEGITTPAQLLAAIGLHNGDGAGNMKKIDAFVSKEQAKGGPDSALAWSNTSERFAMAKAGGFDGSSFGLSPAASRNVQSLWLDMSPSIRAQYGDKIETFVATGIGMSAGASDNGAKFNAFAASVVANNPGQWDAEPQVAGNWIPSLVGQIALNTKPLAATFPSNVGLTQYVTQTWAYAFDSEQRTKYGNDINKWLAAEGISPTSTAAEVATKLTAWVKKGGDGLYPGEANQVSVSGAAGALVAKPKAEQNVQDALNGVGDYAPNANVHTGNAYRDALEALGLVGQNAAAPSPPAELLQGASAVLNLAGRPLVSATTAPHLSRTVGSLRSADTSAPLAAGAKQGTLATLDGLVQNFDDAYNSLSDMSQLQMMRLQQASEDRSKLMEAISNLMKQDSSTQDAIVANLKGS